MKNFFFKEILAEAILRREVLLPLQSIEPDREKVPYWITTSLPDQRIVEEMAICLSDKYPQRSLELVHSEAGSKAEQLAFDSIIPLLAPCLVHGAKLHANHVVIRLALAVALYHRAKDSADMAQGKKN